MLSTEKLPDPDAEADDHNPDYCPTDRSNMRIPHSGPKAEDKRDSRNYGLQDPHVYSICNKPYTPYYGISYYNLPYYTKRPLTNTSLVSFAKEAFCSQDALRPVPSWRFRARRSQSRCITVAGS